MTAQIRVNGIKKELSELSERFLKVLEVKNYTGYKLAKEVSEITESKITFIRNGRNEPSKILLDSLLLKFPDVSRVWLLTGEGHMITSEKELRSEVEEINVVEPYVMDVHENKNANKFIKLPNGQYLMTMPLAEYNIQAGFLDHFQDLDYLADMAQHSIIVDKPVQGRYIAFRVKGDSMDDGTSEAIVQNSIVSCRELQMHHWTSKLRAKDFPYWVIYTTESRYPLLKQIINHDIDNGKILCHSLNMAPEYSDFELNLNDVQALFYVVDVSRTISKKLIY